MVKKLVDKLKILIAIILISLSFVFVLLDVVKSFSVSNFYAPYIVILPVIIMIVLKMFAIQEKYMFVGNNIYFVFLMSIIEYLGLVLLNKMEFTSKIKVSTYMLTAIYFLIYHGLKDHVIDEKAELKDTKNVKKIFGLYYINTDKVYEIAMLLNNKIITGGTSENETESSLHRQETFGINTNLSYLKSVKGELNVSQNTQIQNSLKNRVLENFDVKTTKSNMLSDIIDKAKPFKENEQINLGDLVLLKNASLKLLNEEESYAVTKMILNGAFKNTKISSNSDDMKIEFDLSAMINSILKDCAYELGCVVGKNRKFLLTIPMTFENDFENSYNIYDLQVGCVTVVGIYRGNRQYEKRLSLQDIFSDDSTNKKENSYEDNEYQLLQSSGQKESYTVDYIKDVGNQLGDYQEVIDVIAIIQEINAE